MPIIVLTRDDCAHITNSLNLAASSKREDLRNPNSPDTALSIRDSAERDERLAEGFSAARDRGTTGEDAVYVMARARRILADEVFRPDVMAKMSDEKVAEEFCDWFNTDPDPERSALAEVLESLL